MTPQDFRAFLVEQIAECDKLLLDCDAPDLILSTGQARRELATALEVLTIYEQTKVYQ
jgi:hypothetical protein